MRWGVCSVAGRVSIPSGFSGRRAVARAVQPYGTLISSLSEFGRLIARLSGVRSLSAVRHGGAWPVSGILFRVSGQNGPGVASPAISCHRASDGLFENAAAACFRPSRCESAIGAGEMSAAKWCFLHLLIAFTVISSGVPAAFLHAGGGGSWSSDFSVFRVAQSAAVFLHAAKGEGASPLSVPDAEGAAGMRSPWCGIAAPASAEPCIAAVQRANGQTYSVVFAGLVGDGVKGGRVAVRQEPAAVLAVRRVVAGGVAGDPVVSSSVSCSRVHCRAITNPSPEFFSLSSARAWKRTNAGEHKLAEAVDAVKALMAG